VKHNKVRKSHSKADSQRASDPLINTLWSLIQA